VADCTEEDGVEFSQLVDGGIGQGFAGSHVSFAAEVEFVELDFEIEFLGGGF